MKTTFIIASALFVLCFSARAEEEIAPRSYETLPRFGIPDEFYTDHYYAPFRYLQVCEVENPKAKLSHSEKVSAALLVVAADQATTAKYGKSYGVSMGSPLMELLSLNFPTLRGVRPTHDVDKGELPMRDLGAFFKAWLQQRLFEKTRDGRFEREGGDSE